MIVPLCFRNPTFRPGTNLVIKRGVQWAGASGIVTLADQHGVSLPMVTRFARIKQTKLLAFNSLTDQDLEVEHDPTCRTVEGLFADLVSSYPEFDSREIVTLVYFEVKTS